MHWQNDCKTSSEEAVFLAAASRHPSAPLFEFFVHVSVTDSTCICVGTCLTQEKRNFQHAYAGKPVCQQAVVPVCLLYTERSVLLALTAECRGFCLVGRTYLVRFYREWLAWSGAVE